MKNKIAPLLAVWLLVFPSCNRKPSVVEQRNSSCLHKYIKEGDIVARRGKDMISDLFATMNITHKDFSHCGIMLVEQDTPYVYHAIGLESNPDGKLKREKLIDFIDAKENACVGLFRYDLKKTEIALLKQEVKEIYKQGPVFDFQFDLRTDDSLYCAEFVAKMINTASQDPDYISSAILNGKRYIPVENILFNGHVAEVCRVSFK